MEGIMKVFLYTLSTCPWCHKAKQFFKKKQIPFDYVDYDLQQEPEQEKIMEKMLELTGGRAFPVVVIGSQVVMGYDPEKYSEAMGLKEEKPSRRIRLRVKLSILVVFIVTMGTLVWLNANMMLFDINRIMNAFQRLGEIGPVAYIFTRAVTVIILLPSLPLDAMAGARFGAFLGSIYSIIGDESGALISFFLARSLGREAVTRLFRKDIAFCDECAERQLVYVVFFARLLPMISFGLISYGAGLTRISTRAFALATLLGMIPLTFLVTYLGGHFKFFNGTSLILGAILVASFFLVPIWIRRKNPWGLYDRMKGSARGQKQTRLA
jgi:uncharacterized membrane protein YdjX (TVP38/TMEM64 family)/glutaredoxin